MSIKKVKISELKQLPQEADASDIFMPGADSNNKTYRVPLSRYDNAKGEADTAAAAANAAAQAATTAADEANVAAELANNAAQKNNATIYTAGLVRSDATAYLGYPDNAVVINILNEESHYMREADDIWDEVWKNGYMRFYDGRPMPMMTVVFEVDNEYCILTDDLYNLLTWPATRRNNFMINIAVAVVGKVVMGMYECPYPFTEGLMTFTSDNPMTCWINGRSVLTLWNRQLGVMKLEENGPYWETVGGITSIKAEATIAQNTGTPTVTVTNTGTETKPVLKFHFSGLKGAPGTVNGQTVSDYITSKLQELVLTFNNDSSLTTEEEKSGASYIQNYDGDDPLTNGVKFLYKLILSGFAGYPVGQPGYGVNPLSLEEDASL